MPPASAAPASTAALRSANQARVVRLLQEEGSAEAPLTQADIARATALAPATVSNIVRELAAAGLLDTVAGSGRRGTTVRIARAAGLIAGVEFGHNHLRVAVADLGGQVLGETTREIAPDHAFDDGLDLANDLLAETLRTSECDRSEVLTIGVGLPAPIPTDGVVRSPAILPGWVGVHALAEAEKRFELPVHLDNDANLGALAEHRRGAGQGHESLLYVKISSGVGSGLIAGGEVFRGAHGTAGELGHLSMDERGPICRCGNRGCLEAYVSVPHVLSLLQEQLPGADFADVILAATAGNLAALRVFEDIGHHLGWALAIAVNLLNPSVVVIGGEMSRAGDHLLAPTLVGMRRHALASVAESTTLAVANLGSRASLMGALLLAQDRTAVTLPNGNP